MAGTPIRQITTCCESQHFEVKIVSEQVKQTKTSAKKTTILAKDSTESGQVSSPVEAKEPEQSPSEYDAILFGLAQLNTPIPQSMIKQRRGAGNMMLDYIEWAYAWHAMSQAFPQFTMEVLSIQTIPFTKTPRGQAPIADASIVTTIRIWPNKAIAPDFYRDGVGTSLASKGEDAPKDSASDAFKRALVLLGVGIELYDKDESYKHLLSDQISTLEKPNAGTASPVAAPRAFVPAGVQGLKGTPQYNQILVLAAALGTTYADLAANPKLHLPKVLDELPVERATKMIAWLEKQIAQKENK
jgi:hypothetical protein